MVLMDTQQEVPDKKTDLIPQENETEQEQLQRLRDIR